MTIYYIFVICLTVQGMEFTVQPSNKLMTLTDDKIYVKWCSIMYMWQKFVYLGFAGGAGTITRYLLSGVVQRNVTTTFPLGTAAVNIIGCLFFGLFWAIVENRLSISGQMRTVIFVGFFGAFTTFSSFVFETGQLLDESQWLWAVGNVLFQNVTGIGCVLTGLAVGKMI